MEGNIKGRKERREDDENYVREWINKVRNLDWILVRKVILVKIDRDERKKGRSFM